MQSGAPTFGTPEPALVLYVMAALARRLGVPFRSGGNLCASKVADAQAAYESAATFQPTILAGVNFVLHAAGWLEGGLAIGYEKFILDLDQCGMAGVFVKGVDLSENFSVNTVARYIDSTLLFTGDDFAVFPSVPAAFRSTQSDHQLFTRSEAAADRVAADREPARVDAKFVRPVGDPRGRRERVLDRGGKLVLGREPIPDRHDAADGGIG